MFVRASLLYKTTKTQQELRCFTGWCVPSLSWTHTHTHCKLSWLNPTYCTHQDISFVSFCSKNGPQYMLFIPLYELHLHFFLICIYSIYVFATDSVLSVAVRPDKKAQRRARGEAGGLRDPDQRTVCGVQIPPATERCMCICVYN